MKEILTVEHPEIGIDRLSRIVDCQEMPVRRTPHIGNQNASELVIQTMIPSGVEVYAVDTICGNDRYSTPNQLRLPMGVVVPLAPSSSCKRTVVGKTVVQDGIENVVGEEMIEMFGLIPGRPVADIHQASLEAVDPNNMPIPMMELFARTPDVLKAVLESISESGQITREVVEDGKIVDTTTQALDSVFGLKDSTDASTGVMIPLNGMMAVDVITQMLKGAETSLHLGGPDMIRYTRDTERMQNVGSLIASALSKLGITPTKHCLKISDMTGFGSRLNKQKFASQHSLIVAKNLQPDLVGV